MESSQLRDVLKYNLLEKLGTLQIRYHNFIEEFDLDSVNIVSRCQLPQHARIRMEGSGRAVFGWLCHLSLQSIPGSDHGSKSQDSTWSCM